MEVFSFAIRHIFRKKVRAMLTIAGILIGVLSVVIVSIIGDVGKKAVNAELDSMGIGGLCISAAEQNQQKEFSDMLLEAVQENPYVDEATPLLTKMISIRVCTKKTQSVVWGIGSNAAQIVSLELVHGRLISEEDVRTKAAVCIVDESFAQMHYKRTNIVGKTVELLSDSGYQPFTVVGVVRSGGSLLQGLMGDVVPTFLYAPYSALTGQKITKIVAKLSQEVNETEACASVLATLDTQAGVTQGYQAENLNQQKDRLNGIMDIVTLILSAIGGISLIVAGLSIMTVMLVTVRERTREIGIKKAIGATRKMILFEFLAESFLLSVFGSLTGALLGGAVGLIGCVTMGIPFSVNLNSVLLCILFAVGMGVVFGVYPAAKASALSPADALRVE
ncbi:ABC transporter permease [Phocea massiliensis]|uniref:ABC transporter permease n=1 Tax=Merdimmobilis hominis TaxID=2897707 RepID=A0A939BDW9_9FIRM|nr:ABC transporter permease [Merdimmobilis hominis]MBM6920710.1 ABC transporter permease [Merdimmobilis hominis]